MGYPMRVRKPAVFTLLLTVMAPTTYASNLSYTFLDFFVLDQSVSAVGVQSPVPEQTVTITPRSGDGIAVAGSATLGDRFFFAGEYRSSIIDVDAFVQSQLDEARVGGRFDLSSSSLGFGLRQELARNFDVEVMAFYDSVTFDFGSFAGENFDVSDSGAGARLGFRWNPTRAFELFGGARYSQVRKPLLTERTLTSDTTFQAGIRWFFFEGLGAGVGYESGDVETVTLSLRFSFGNLPW
jgi:hypothetical protein